MGKQNPREIVHRVIGVFVHNFNLLRFSVIKTAIVIVKISAKFCSVHLGGTITAEASRNAQISSGMSKAPGTFKILNIFWRKTNVAV